MESSSVRALTFRLKITSTRPSTTAATSNVRWHSHPATNPSIDLDLRLLPPGGLPRVLADINDSMLKVGRDRLLDRGIANNIQFAQANAQYLPFPDNSFDVITIAFGLRNVTDKEMALRSMYRVLKPGGKLLVLEFSKPPSTVLSKIYDGYSFNILPKLGKLFASDADSYQYLAESIRMHPDQETLKGMVEEAGFSNCDYHNMTGASFF